MEADAHRLALLEWLDELNAKYGEPTPEDYAAADDLLDLAGFGGARAEHKARAEHHSGAA